MQGFKKLEKGDNNIERLSQKIKLKIGTTSHKWGIHQINVTMMIKVLR